MASDRTLRFTFVIARYGAGVLGGAESHARSVAERLALRGHDVRVLTSCASSYVTWNNDLPAGTSDEGGVEVHRFPVSRARKSTEPLLKFLSSVFPHQASLAGAWARAQGPILPDLLARLSTEASQRDLLVFFQLLSPPTLFGLESVGSRSALVPLVHKERGVDTVLARRALASPRVLLVNTAAEARTIATISPGAIPSLPPMRVVAVGVDPPAAAGTPPDLPGPYIVAMGRAGKLKPLLRTWRALMTQKRASPMQTATGTIAWDRMHLVIVGEHADAYATLPNVVQVGYVDDPTRLAILRGAVALINPSLYESLSLVLLEAWTESRPVIVNARCDVTADLARQSGGGLIVDFENPGEAAARITAGLELAQVRNDMGKRGRAFVAAAFDWDRVLGEYEAVARSVAAGEPLTGNIELPSIAEPSGRLQG